MPRPLGPRERFLDPGRDTLSLAIPLFPAAPDLHGLAPLQNFREPRALACQHLQPALPPRSADEGSESHRELPSRQCPQLLLVSSLPHPLAARGRYLAPVRDILWLAIA